MKEEVLFILAAPNVSEQYGGEAIKALQIYKEIKKRYKNSILITHSRNKHEVENRLGLNDVHFIHDSTLDRFLWSSKALRWWLNWWFSKRAAKAADAIINSVENTYQRIVFWQTEPNSPVVPRARSMKAFNCFGPINGNIYYPRCFHNHETFKVKLRRWLHFPAQYVNRLFFNELAKADLIFAAGGERTTSSLKALGVSEKIVFETVDCGIQSKMFDYKRIDHSDVNLKFVHFGRLVFHKGTYLIIHALSHTKLPVMIDIIGRGPELEKLKALTHELGLMDRVTFLDWFTDHSELFESLDQYRGFVLPSLEDANGIVVQEALAVGLPTIALKWGGPQLLIRDGETGFLISPDSEKSIITDIAVSMDALAADGVLANEMSEAGRKSAMTWSWDHVIEQWRDQILVAADKLGR